MSQLKAPVVILVDCTVSDDGHITYTLPTDKEIETAIENVLPEHGPWRLDLALTIAPFR